MTRPGAIVALLVLASSCAHDEPKASATSEEIARLERDVAANPLPPSQVLGDATPAPEAATKAPAAVIIDGRKVVPEVVDVSGAKPPTPVPTLSKPFVIAATEARRLIEEDLPRDSTRNDQPKFDVDLARVRAKLQEARQLARSDDDRNVHLLLTMILVKDKERFQTVFLSRRSNAPAGLDSTIAELYQQREVCAEEVIGWLFRGSDPAALRAAACLTEARAAAALVGAG